MNDFLSSTRTFELKSKVAKLIKQYDYPMVLNVVLHRLNIDHVQQILEMAERWTPSTSSSPTPSTTAGRYLNRDQLLPSREQLQRAEEITNKFRERVGNGCGSTSSCPTTTKAGPKACMNGWGSVFLNVTADGIALPCHEARMLPGLDFPERARPRPALDLVRLARLQRATAATRG